MTAEPDLLPLPDVKCWRAMKDRNGNVGYSDKPDPKYSESAGTDGLTWVRLNDHRAAMQAYARACVSSATATQAAEIEALRAEVAKRVEGFADRAEKLEARAERMAEALRIAEAALADIGDADREPGDDVAWCERRAAQALPTVRAALDQDTTNG